MNNLRRTLSGCVFFSVAAFLFYYAIAGRRPLPPSQDPMLFPKVLLILIMGLALLLIIGELTGRVRGAETRVRVGLALISCVLVVVYVVGMFHIGFIPATVLFLSVMPFVLGYRSVVPIVGVMVGVTGGVWFAFTHILKVFLPEIPLDF